MPRVNVDDEKPVAGWKPDPGMGPSCPALAYGLLVPRSVVEAVFRQRVLSNGGAVAAPATAPAIIRDPIDWEHRTAPAHVTQVGGQEALGGNGDAHRGTSLSASARAIAASKRR